MDRLNRRAVLCAGGLSLFGLSMNRLLAARETLETQGPGFGRAKSCILLFMWGGPAHQDTWDMKPDAPAEIRGEFQPIATKVPGIQICEHFPQLAQRTDRLAIVRSMTHTDVDHLTSTHFLLTGQPPPPSPERQCTGRTLVRCCRSWDAEPVPCRRSFRCGPSSKTTCRGSSSRATGNRPAGSARPSIRCRSTPTQPSRLSRWRHGLAARNVPAAPRTTAGIVGRPESAPAPQARSFEARDASTRRAFELLTSATGERGAFDLNEEPAAMRERYGLNPHGQSVLQARRLVERGVPLVTVFWPSDGIKNVSVYWDTHNRNFHRLEARG